MSEHINPWLNPYARSFPSSVRINKKDEKPGLYSDGIFLCSPLYLKSYIQDGDTWGYVLCVLNPNNEWVEKWLPASRLALLGNGAMLIEALLDMGWITESLGYTLEEYIRCQTKLVRELRENEAPCS